MKHLTNRIALILAFLGMSCASAFAQQVKGTVKDAAGEPVIGAAVMVEGSSVGTIVYLDGSFVLDGVKPGEMLVVSSIGYTTLRIPATEGDMEIVLAEDSEMLDDVVVVGYGVQKKSVVSAAISSISSEKLKAQSQTRIDNVLQGMTSGVTVTQTSGAPDSGSSIRIRGNGTINNADPLYIVDGLAISGGIDYLNPNDIERIEVLKDAASGAVYGSRATNGVILVTTKKGKAGAARVDYDFSCGWQNLWRKPQVLNATEYAIMMNEGYINNGDAPRYDDPYSFGEGTDWVEAILNKNAPVTKHDLSVSGANDKVNYRLSAGYLSREGTVGGNFGRSNYDRVTVNGNLGINVIDSSSERDWLNKLDLTASVAYAHTTSTGISQNTEYGSPLGSALGMSPLEPIFATDEMIEEYKQITVSGVSMFPYMARSKDGRIYSIADGIIYNEQKNPLAMLEQPGSKNWSDKFISNFAAELQIWKHVKLRSSLGLDMSFWGSDSYWLPHYLSSKDYSFDQVNYTITYDKDGNEVRTPKTAYASGASQSMNRQLRWQLENVISYSQDFGKHSVSAIVGQSAMSQSGSNVGASAKGLKFPYDEYMISVNTTNGLEVDGDRNGWGSWNSVPYRLFSFFGRASYNYDERYMVEGTIRLDASSHFGHNNKWGAFPSFSAGWNIKNEEFMRDYTWLSQLKLRASWGINGNDAIGDFMYAVYMSSGNNYAFGSGALGSESINLGVKPSGLSNPDIKWEQSRQTDLGVDFGALGDRLTATVDFYVKNTADMLYDLQVPGYAGDSAPKGNVGTMTNSGVEIELGWRDAIGDFHYHVSANATYNRNRLTYLGEANADGETPTLGGESHKIGTLSRGEVGLPFPYFWGYKTDGIFQNAEEVASYVNADGEKLQPLAVPGDVRFVDINKDGRIDDKDRTMIGKGMPDWNFGFNIGFEYKGFDFNMLLQGVLGAQTFNVTRRTDLYYINLPKTILNRWTGEGTTNKYPRFTFQSANENYRVSDLWLEDASYLRARNVQIGYTLPQSIVRKVRVQRLRVYGQVENLFTLTRYTGCDPEVGSGTSVGIDRGVYPQARTFSIGANLSF